MKLMSQICQVDTAQWSNWSHIFPKKKCFSSLFETEKNENFVKRFDLPVQPKSIKFGPN